jgi:hypothetical protein
VTVATIYRFNTGEDIRWALSRRMTPILQRPDADHLRFYEVSYFVATDHAVGLLDLPKPCVPQQRRWAYTVFGYEDLLFLLHNFTDSTRA